ncbi:MAG TPA: hypothetical protein VM733_22215, partial [Thermoanaerobaculia bacterium]|nr:hypothetical protein [Thermoanaerobaculia bacterium]
GVIVRPSDAAIAAQHEYEIIKAELPSYAAAAEPAWVQTPGAVFKFGDLTFKEVTPTSYPVSSGTGTPYKGYNNHVWLSELLHRTVEDPWFQVRTKGRVDGKTTGLGTLNVPHPTDYATLADADMTKADDYMDLNVSRSHYFQYQTYDNRPNYRAVRVPRFDYDFWKAAAITGRGQKNVYYLEWVSGSDYTNGAETKDFESWVQTSPGFFFFETKNKMNPQKGGPGVLVPIDASICGAKGVVYMNTKSIKTTGCSAVDAWYNQPGEPYRDIGYRKVNEETTGGLNQKKGFTVDGDGKYIRDKAYNNRWDYQDLPWTNGQSAKNDTFDVCMGQRRVYRQSDNKVLTEWLPLPYYPNCNVGNNFSNPTCDCSEPFEPYLNLHYAGTKLNLQAYWDDPFAIVSVQPKKTTNETPTGAPEACTGGAISTKEGQERCATNAFDKRGAIAWMDKNTNESAISVEGVIYNEGAYESTGNTAYYGSVVVTGLVSPQGTQEIWYDSCLADDCWPPKHIPFPRVMINSTQIQ